MSDEKDLSGVRELDDFDPALASAVLELESHAADVGWDQPPRLYALVETGELLHNAPELADLLGLEEDAAGLTPVEQEPLTRDLEDELLTIGWPPAVAGCAVVAEQWALPPEAIEAAPADHKAGEEYARNHPLAQPVRVVAGVTRAGAAYCAVRLRARDDANSVAAGPDLAPGLVLLLRGSLDDDSGTTP